MNVTTIIQFFSLGILVNAQGLKRHFVLKNTVDDNITTKTDDDWWRTAIVYQIYPRSFMDSNGDGIGDLKGIISKLDYIKDMGVTAVWLSPIYKSPGVDQGYDISDYRAIDPIFGNISDLQTLVAKAHEMGIKILMDFVPNHTSNQHDWFKESVKSNATYKDYYVWVGNKKDEVPNNWLSVFGGSAWEWNEERQAFYLHQFATAQPDLNLTNPNVVQACKDILKFWLDFGIDGFRMDAVPFLFEDSEFRNEPPSGLPGLDSMTYEYLRPIYTTNLDASYDLVYEFRAFMDVYNKNQTYSRILMTEAYTETIQQTMRYYGNGSTNGAHFTFNFNFVTNLRSTTNLMSGNLITFISRWLSNLDQKYVSNWVLGNHDEPRVATRLGVDNVDPFNMLTAFLPGVQVTYMGEEIGMENGNVTCGQSRDPRVMNCSTFTEQARDFERTPFQWDDTANAGFSTNSSTWLPVSDKYKTTNVKAQNVAGIKSHYNVYKGMAKFRQNFKKVSYDSLSLYKISDKVLEIIRRTDKGEYVYLFNSGDSTETFNISTDDIDFEVLVTGMNSGRSIGNRLSNFLTLQPHECLVVQVVFPDAGSNLYQRH